MQGQRHALGPGVAPDRAGERQALVHDGAGVDPGVHAGVDAGGENEGGTETALAGVLVVDGTASGVITLDVDIELAGGTGVEAGAATEGDVEGKAAGLLAGAGEPYCDAS